MPYNNAPIGPSEEITGTSKLPLARVKKIIAQDDEISQCTTGSIFALSVATEIFVRYLTNQAYTVVKSEKKPRRNIAYKDVATAVSRIDNLEFLSDVVPKTKTYRQFREEKARDEAAAAEKASAVKLNGTNPELQAKPIDAMLEGGSNSQSLDTPAVSYLAQVTSPVQPNGQSTLVERTIHHNNHDHSAIGSDVEMSG